MSFLGFGGAPQPTSAQKIAAAETELEMVTDMFNRLSNSCTKKCIPMDYKEGELNKGESVCLDRCVSKFFEVNIKVSTSHCGGEAGLMHCRSRSRCRICSSRHEAAEWVLVVLAGLDNSQPVALFCGGFIFGERVCTIYEGWIRKNGTLYITILNGYSAVYRYETRN
jgi:import inner membrane translocase subunit TIM10